MELVVKRYVRRGKRLLMFLQPAIRHMPLRNVLIRVSVIEKAENADARLPSPELRVSD
jgi:hypothetical protein